MKKLLGVVLLLTASVSEAQYAYQAITRNVNTTGQYCSSTSLCNVTNSGAAFHQLTWTISSGTLSACSVRVDSSADGVTWGVGDVIAAQTCTSNGTITSTSHVVNFVRVNVTAITPVSGGVLNIGLTGYANLPSGGGTVTQINTSAPLSGGPITTTGTISCPTCGTGTVTNIATTSPLSGGPITGTGTISCPTCSTTTGTVTNIATTSPLSGGPITSTGTLSCPTCGTVTNIATTAPLAGGPVTTTGTLTCTTCVTTAGLTSGRVTTSSGANAVSDSANLTYDGTNLNLATGGVFSWASDAGFSRLGPAIVAMGTAGASSTAGRLKLAAVISAGTTFTASGTCSQTTLVGGASAGKFTVGTSSACTITLVMGNTATATNGWTCTAYDMTTIPTVAIRQTATTTTNCALSMQVTSGDVIVFSAVGW